MDVACHECNPYLWSLGILAILGVSAGGLGAWVWAARARAGARAEAAAWAAGRAVRFQDRNAAFFGVRSAGWRQVRGNGVLVVTDEALWFRRLVPARTWVIPLDRVRGVSTPKVFLGKTALRPLVAVEFLGEAGTPDAAAWAVRNPQALVRALEGA
ncbi:hypothetical protein [Deferrisoma sp.]